MTNSSDSLIYNLSYLSSVIHPVIILRLLEHRLFTPLFKKKLVTSNPPPPSNPWSNAENKQPPVSILPQIGTAALVSIPTLPKPDACKRQRSSLTKDSTSSSSERPPLIIKLTQTTSEKYRKSSKGNNANSISPSSGSNNTTILSGNNALSTVNTSASGNTTNSDISPVRSTQTPLVPTMSISNIAGNGSNQGSSSILLSGGTTSTNSNPTITSRILFWRSSEKSAPSNLPNDRNPLLQAIVENDTLASSNNLSGGSSTNLNVAGVGEIKLLEKELLNLPSFQLSDSQNPLLPSPTCLSCEFSSAFDDTTPMMTNQQTKRVHSSSSTSSTTKVGQLINNLSIGTSKSRNNEDDGE